MSKIRFRDPAGSIRTGARTNGTITFADRQYSVDEVDILPPVSPSKIVCVGLNYKDHAEEAEASLPDRPLLFLKGPNTVAGHGDTVTLPKGKERIDYEAELAAVVGEQCRNVSREEAMDVLAGFTCLNDLSNRDDQQVEQNWIRGKAFDNSAPFGPVVAPVEDVPSDASIVLRQNGEVRQDSSRDKMIFSIPEIVEEVTQYMTLEEGDVIATGTPAGIGPLQPGDTIEIEIEGVGTLTHSVSGE